MTQLEFAERGIFTKELKYVAEQEEVDPKKLIDLVAKGRVVIPANINHTNLKPVGIGESLRIKVNTNLGTSKDESDVSNELAKLSASLAAGTDTVMDLSTGGDIDLIRQSIIKHCPKPVGTVPIYQAAVEASAKRKGVIKMEPEELFDIIEKHGEDGVDFITVHAGVTITCLKRLKKQGRLTDIVSRGGAFLAQWMVYNQKENPLFEHYERLLDIAKKFDITLSLGDGLRPGCVSDATDRAQILELITLGELAKQAKEKGVQVMIEGPGHVPLQMIEANIELEKSLCDGAPFYVLGPIVTDIAPGYDHITAAIGGAIAGKAGADFLCYVTPSEHLRLPSVEDVHAGVIASRIAAHAADITKENNRAIEWDKDMARARKSLDWDRQHALAIDPKKMAELRSQSLPSMEDVCTMCGEYCAIKGVENIMESPFLD